METPSIISKNRILAETENLQPNPENLTGEGKGNKHKRSPQTPSTKQMNITRRRFDDPDSTTLRSLSFTSQNAELMQARYENWKLSQRLVKSNQTLEFLELERRLEREA